MSILRFKVLALDPSSSCTGWAVGFVDGKSFKILDAGRIVPPAKMNPIQRADFTADRIVDVRLGRYSKTIKRIFPPIPHCCEVAVVEVPSSRGSFHGTAGSGLAVYGFAAGVVWKSVEPAAVLRRIAVTPETWTGSRTKENRKRIALKWFPDLEKLSDPGMDVSDAVSLAVWAYETGILNRAEAQEG